MKKCIHCHIDKEDSRFTKDNKTCKFCAWIEKHQFSYPINWDKKVADNMLRMIFDGQVKYLNELETVTNKSIEEIIQLISVDLDLHNIGNQKLMVQKKCEICGNLFDVHIGYYYKNKFCSRECYSKYRSIFCVGERASVYTKTEQECTYCHKKMLIPKNRLATINKEGKNHHFCSKECYYQFRKEYYVGDKLYNTGITLSDELRDKIRINTVKQYSNGSIDRQTQPQLLVNQMLDELGIAYTNEKNYKYYSLDNYLDDYNLLIEVMGDYFHANPMLYSFESINNMQKKDVIRDKRKRTYIKKYYNINILYLWEQDIISNYSKCKSLINLYVQNNGLLNDYQSFNYNNDLSLKTEIINPFFIKNP